jgi:lipoic acid synthetase
MKQIKPALQPKPSWLKRALPANNLFYHVGEILKEHRLNTVCASAVCPNRWECYGRGTATFLIMGNICTRACRFCAVTQGTPLPLDPDEPKRLALAVKKLSLRHVVITSVTRDDLPDGGSRHFRKTIDAVRTLAPSVTIEVLTPDFLGKEGPLKTVLGGKPDVFAHNVEMAPRLYPLLRKKLSSYERSLDVLRAAAKIEKNVRLKSGLMVGLGETDCEVCGVLRDLAGCGVNIITIGQYLQPKKNSAAVAKFVASKTFKYYYDTAKELGIAVVYAAPFVRSSYRAEEALI